MEKMKLLKVVKSKVGDRSSVSNQLQKLHFSVNKVVNQLIDGHTTMSQIVNQFRDEKDFNPAGKTYVKAYRARQDLADAMDSLLKALKSVGELSEETK